MEIKNLTVRRGQTALCGVRAITIPDGTCAALFGSDPFKRTLLRVIGTRGAYVEDETVVIEHIFDNGCAYVEEADPVWGWMTVLEYGAYRLGGNADALSTFSRYAFEADYGYGTKLKHVSAAAYRMTEAFVRAAAGATLLCINLDHVKWSKAALSDLKRAVDVLTAQGVTVFLALRDARFRVYESAFTMQCGFIEPLHKTAPTVRRFVLRPTGDVKLLAGKIRRNTGYRTRVRGGKIHVSADSVDAAKELVRQLAAEGEGLNELKSV